MSSRPGDPEAARAALRVRDEFGVALPLAMRLIHRFGSVEAIAEASIDDLIATDKVGVETATRIRATAGERLE